MTTFLRMSSTIGSNVAIGSNPLQMCGADFALWRMEIRTGGVTQEFGDIMDDFTTESQKLPVLVIIEQHVLARTCILNILKRELTGFEIVEMATTIGLSWLSGRDIRLIALNIGDKQITDPAIEVSLAFLAEFLSESIRCPVVKS